MRPCFRTIDKPQIIFGLEMEDISLIALGVGVGCLLFQPLIPGVLGISAWIGLAQFKKGKPLGFVVHCLYAQGVTFPGLLPSYKRVKRYAVYASHQKQK